VPLGDYLAGVAWLGLSLGTVAVATALVARRRLAGLTGEVRLLAVFLVAIAALVGIHLLPLLLGVLTRATPVAAGALLCVALWRLLPVAPPSRLGGAPPGPPGSRPAWVVAALAAGAAAVGLLAYTAAVALVPFVQVDVVNFHLPGVARWIQSGSLWHADQFLAYQAQAYYPNTGDLVHLAAVLPWHQEFAVRYIALPFVAATGVGVYALARELRAPAPTAVIFAAVAVTLPTVLVSNVDFELTDAIMYATFVAGALFLARHVRTRAGIDLALAGIGLGLSFGVKWYAVSSVAVVVAVWAAGLLVARRGWRPVLGDVARLVGLVAAFGGIWLVRNWVEAGNPVFPVPVRVLGVTVFDAPYDLYRHLAGFTLLDYVDRPTILRVHAWPAFNRTLGLGWLVAVGGCLVAVGAALGRRRRLDGRVAAAIGAAALLAVAYVATPYSALGGRDVPAQIAANTRYAIPALLLALAVTAGTAGRLGRLAIAVDLLGLAAVADGVRRGFAPVEAKHWLAGALVGALGAAAFVAWRHARPLPRPGWGAAAAAAILGLAAGGYAAQRRFVEHRYRAVEAPLAWTGQAAHRRVALAGLWDVDGLSPVYPAFGPRLGNRVEYVGPVRRGMLMQYRAPAPFVAALGRGRYDLVVVGRAREPVATGVERWPLLAGYRQVAASPRLLLFQAR
jgi:hypothetical protein